MVTGCRLTHALQANGGIARLFQSARFVLPPQCCYGGRVAAVAGSLAAKSTSERV